MTLQEYLRAQLVPLIDQVHTNSAGAGTEEGIHDLRVSIRRLSETLRVFKDVLPKGAARGVRKELRAAMKLAGAARNHDIAIELLAKAELAPEPQWQSDRDAAEAQLRTLLVEWHSRAATDGWRRALHV